MIVKHFKNLGLIESTVLRVGLSLKRWQAPETAPHNVGLHQQTVCFTH